MSFLPFRASFSNHTRANLVSNIPQLTSGITPRKALSPDRFLCNAPRPMWCRAARHAAPFGLRSAATATPRPRVGQSRCFRGQRSEAVKRKTLKRSFSSLAVSSDFSFSVSFVKFRSFKRWMAMGTLRTLRRLGEIVSCCFHCLAWVCYWWLASQKADLDAAMFLGLFQGCMWLLHVTVLVEAVFFRVTRWRVWSLPVSRQG